MPRLSPPATISAILVAAFAVMAWGNEEPRKNTIYWLPYDPEAKLQEIERKLDAIEASTSTTLPSDSYPYINEAGVNPIEDEIRDAFVEKYRHKPK